MSSKRDIKSNVSNFFTKNKSLKFFIGDEIGSRPKSSKNQTNKNNHKRGYTTNLFNSLRVVKDE